MILLEGVAARIGLRDPVCAALTFRPAGAGDEPLASSSHEAFDPRVADSLPDVACRIAHVAVFVLAMIVTSAPAARAQPSSDGAPAVDKKVCIAAAERGQELRDAKHMRDARGQFALCARPECPTSVAKECGRWLSEVEAAFAAVKLEAVDDRGEPLGGVKVIIDGAPWSDEVPPAPVLLDPGSHEIRFEHGADAPVIRSVTLSMGDRDRVLRAAFAPPKAAEKPATPLVPKQESEPKPVRSSSLAAPIVLGSVGVLSFGAAATFWVLGNSDLEAARARCQSGCPGSETDGARMKHMIGDIAMGVGIVSLVAATYFLLTREAPRPVGRF
jgi:hypothetical protein